MYAILALKGSILIANPTPFPHSQQWRVWVGRWCGPETEGNCGQRLCQQRGWASSPDASPPWPVFLREQAHAGVRRNSELNQRSQCNDVIVQHRPQPDTARRAVGSLGPNPLTSSRKPTKPNYAKWVGVTQLLLAESKAETTNKARGSCGIPAELFQILKDDAVKVLHSTCQQIWKTRPQPQDWERSVFIPIPKKGNAKECSNCLTVVLISHANKAVLKSLQARLQQFMNREQQRLTLRALFYTYAQLPYALHHCLFFLNP